MSEELVSEAAVPFSVVCAAAICSDIAVPPVANIPAVIMTTRYTTFKNNLGFILLIFKESQ
jgi:hypothetical protein